MHNLGENPTPSLSELGAEPLLGSGFEAELLDSDSTLELTLPVEEGSR